MQRTAARRLWGNILRRKASLGKLAEERRSRAVVVEIDGASTEGSRYLDMEPLDEQRKKMGRGPLAA